MMIRQGISLVLMAGLSAAMLAGCEESYDDGKGPQIDCATSTVPSYEEVSMFAVCENCHASTLSGSDRNHAPSDVNFDTFAAAREAAADSLFEVYNGDMPIDGYTLTDEQRQAFYAWAQCDTPE